MEFRAQGRASTPLREIGARVRELRTEIQNHAHAVGRDPYSIRLCGVTKFHPREAVYEAVASGIMDIGESYLQEARDKYVDLSGVTKHFIGHVQTNKAKAIVAAFDVIQSVDRPQVGDAIAKACKQLDRRVRTLVQVNISPQDRFGAAPESAKALADYLRSLDLEVDGIMALGPNTGDRDALRSSFEEAARVFAQIGGSTLSIGMSGDWREAVACGSTMIRIGTAIFGPRPATP
jgi:pyridoxal phosphate enzyme (YggS family)